MSAKHALLGLLLDRPAYPYQLADQMQVRLGPTWKVNSGQLYQTIKTLESDGLIERVHEVSQDHENRHVFEITDDGVVEFERFFDQTPDAVRLCRRPLLVKITFAGPQRLQDALAKVGVYERECARRLAETAHLREEMPADDPRETGGTLLRADHLLLRLNLSADIFQLEGELRWAAHAREMLSWLADQDAIWPGERERPESDTERRRRDRAAARRELFGRIAGSHRRNGDAPPNEQGTRSE